MAIFDFIVRGDEGPEERNFGHVFQYGDGSVRPLANIESAVYEIRKFSPGGANTILIGLANSQGIKIRKDPNGVINVLIGLLLPAIEKLTEGQGPVTILPYIESALKPGGKAGFVMADGSVRFTHDPPNTAQAQGTPQLWQAFSKNG